MLVIEKNILRIVPLPFPLPLLIFLVKYTQGYFLGLPRAAKNLKKMCLPSDFKISRSQLKISRDT